MLVKVLVLALCAALLAGTATDALKVRKSQRQAVAATEQPSPVESPQTSDSETEEAPSKDVQKRGIFYNGGGLWPKTYAAHYGYNLQLPAAAGGFSSFALAAPAAHAPHAFLRYAGGVHYKAHPFAAVASPAFATAATVPVQHAAALPHAHVYGAAAGVPHAHVFGAAAGVPHAHVYGAAAAVPAAAAAPSYVLRPGGAVVSSYSVNYPHHKAAVAIPAVQPVAPVAPLQPAYHVPAVQAVQPVHPVQPVQPVQPIQPVQPVYHVQRPQFVQTTFVQQPPVAAAVPFTPVQPAAPAFPAIPTFPAAPAFPGIPQFPAQPQAPQNPVFQQQPPQQNPTFISIPLQPEQGPQGFPQFPPFAQPQNPADGGSAVAAPQIPNTPARVPAPTPEPELPAAAQPTQQPWKPLVYGPPAVGPAAGSPSNVNSPAVTLLPPFGTPAEGYLPPSAPAQQQQQQQSQQLQQQQHSALDNLSDAEIEHLFAQAHLAHQRAASAHHHRYYQ